LLETGDIRKPIPTGLEDRVIRREEKEKDSKRWILPETSGPSQVAAKIAMLHLWTWYYHR